MENLLLGQDHPQPRVAIYCRTAQDRGANSKRLLKKQKEPLLSLCQEKGYQVVRVFAEICSSYPHNTGEQFRAVREMIKSGQIDVLLADNMDRLSRNMEDIFDLAALAGKHGVRIIDRSGNGIIDIPVSREITEIREAIHNSKR